MGLSRLAVDMKRSQKQMRRIREVWAAYSEHPSASNREIMSLTGITSTSTVNRYRHKLIELEYISYNYALSRSVRVLVPLVTLGDGVRVVKVGG